MKKEWNLILLFLTKIKDKHKNACIPYYALNTYAEFIVKLNFTKMDNVHVFLCLHFRKKYYYK